MTHWGACVSSTHMGFFLVILDSLGKTLFLTTIKGVVLVLWTHEGALDDSWGKLLAGELVDDLNSQGISLAISNLLEDVLDPSNPLGML